MNEGALRQEVLTTMGHPVLCVEASKYPDLVQTAIITSYRWFSAHKGLEDESQLAVVAGINEYTLPETIIDVIDVFPPRTVDASYTDYGFVGGFGGIYVGGIAFGGAGQLGSSQGSRDPYPYSGTMQYLQMNETIARLFGAEFEWDYLNGSLVFSPVPASTGVLLYRFIKALTDISQVRDGSMDQELVVNYVKAELKHLIGRIRSKFDTLPGADGDVSLDGDRLLDEAREDKEKLDEKIKEMSMPMKFIAS